MSLHPWIRSILPVLLLVASASAPPARAAGPDLVVNSAADDDDGACTAAPAGCTLREAIAAVNAGVERSIGFDPAVFPPLTLTPIQVATPLPAIARSGASVDGTGAGVQIDGGGVVAGNGLVFASAAGVALSGVRVRNLTVADFLVVGLFVCAGAVPACDAPLSDVLVENVVSRGGEDGIRIFGSTASNVAVRSSASFANTETGIVVGSTGDASKLSVVGCTAEATGIVVVANGELVAPTVADNVVVDSAGFGINVFAGGPLSKGRVAGNRVTGSVLDGIRIHAEAPSVGTLIEDNHVADNGANGLYVETFAGLSLGRIVGNRAVRNTEFGILVEGSTRTLVQGNRADRNQAGIVLIGTGEGSRVKSNVAIGNDLGIRIGSGHDGVRVTGNRALGNLGLDLDDENGSCGGNRWSRNTGLVVGNVCQLGAP